MEEGEVYILDVRTPAEVDKGRIEGAENLDIFNWEDFTLGVEKLEKSEPVLVYCKVGGRSAKAAKYLVENGFTKVYDLNGGILAWQEAGKSIVKN
jgi:rhodanese-related sulfurtransferase